VQRTFQGNEKLQPADTGFRKVQFLYSSGDTFTFMDLDSYDQFELNSDIIGDGAKFLVEGQEVDARVFEGNPIGIQLPPTVNLKVIETPPGVKGDTATGGTKFAELENGTKVSVPLFINEGDQIKVNTETGVYMERV
ncbi:elongation factor P, partial [Patescibacteria group bacterium]|nr:elongation factor P [Patescibacteria group bacterium]